MAEWGRAPRPRRGDPNVKKLRVALTAEEWRKLRAWAAEEGTSIEYIVEQVVRRELDAKPRRGFV